MQHYIQQIVVAVVQWPVYSYPNNTEAQGTVVALSDEVFEQGTSLTNTRVIIETLALATLPAQRFLIMIYGTIYV